tara:strand:- start:304 stop:540 length:237 start_codon:yes stop_codon:yes gene_type:complete
MKTKNDLLTGILIGIGIIVVPIILMGTTNSTTENDEVGRYQISTNLSDSKMKDYILETIIDTRTGDVISRKRVFVSEY